MLERLVQRAQSGDQGALEELLAEIAPSVERFGRRMCKTEQDAADVLQDTLLTVATHLGEFEGRSSLKSWVFALTRSACARRRRGFRNQAPLGQDDAPEPRDPAASPEERVADRELADALSRALDSLSDEHREVILLRDVEGLSAIEAASTLGVSIDALKSRLHRARGALRTALAPWLEDGARREPPRSDCPEVATLWSKKLEGDLSAGDCAAMEKHVETCAACAGACDALKKALLACQRTGAAVVGPEIQARVKAALRAASQRR